MMAASDLLTSSGATHPGTVRERNEDSLLLRDDLGLWAVADGAGGHGAGDVASQEAVRALDGIPPGLTASEILVQVRVRLQAVHRMLRARAEEEKGPGAVMATTVVVLLARGGHVACLWAGDSRAYRLRDRILERLTHDHSLVQELVDGGAITADEAEIHPQANVITRAVGADGELVLDKMVAPLLPGDRFLLCTDGLTRALPEARIAEAASDTTGADPLVQLAVEAGARDNVTCVLVRPEAMATSVDARDDDETLM